MANAGLMLLGMAFFKLGVLTAARSQAFYVRMALVGFGAGVLLISLAMWRSFATTGSCWITYWSARSSVLGQPAGGLGWVALVMLICQCNWPVRMVASVGRMALSNYLLQTLICTTIFYGHGLGLFGRIERPASSRSCWESGRSSSSHPRHGCVSSRSGRSSGSHAGSCSADGLPSCAWRPHAGAQPRSLLHSRSRAGSSLSSTQGFAARGDAGGDRPHRRGKPRGECLRTVARESALAGARAATRALGRKGGALPPLHGVPVSIKDLTPTKGIRTTWGSLIYRDHVPEEDDLVVQRLKAAGAIVVGKTNTPEFGAGGTTFNALFGATRNPWNTALTCGGSSGGAAVAVATGMAPIAQGTDLGGSLRVPAAFCGVIGFRTTPGLIPRYPRTLAWDSLSVTGPMARTVADVALMLSAIAGPDERVPLSYKVDTERVHARRQGAVDQGLARGVDAGSRRAHPGRRGGGPRRA